VTLSLHWRACPLCDHAQASLLTTKGDLRLVRCPQCRMIFSNPIPLEMASGSYYDHLSATFYLSPDKLAGDYAPVRFKREIALFRSWCSQGAVLDVGCSTGGFLHQIKTRYPNSYSLTGMDVAGGALDYARLQGIETIPGHYLEHDFAARQFDAITFWAVLEHVVNPKPFLAKAVSLLRPGGLCFILVPNMRSLAVRLLGANYRYLMPDHINYFTAESLRRFAREEKSLTQVTMRTCHFNPLVIWQDWRRPQDRVSDADRVRMLKRTTAYKQNPWLWPVRCLYQGVERCLVVLGMADNLAVVLRKSVIEPQKNGVDR
jgi:2-polyprenyl-3-methyl-5-hydroxy-6-metoxy-1,4-benzoquinol methylase